MNPITLYCRLTDDQLCKSDIFPRDKGNLLSGLQGQALLYFDEDPVDPGKAARVDLTQLKVAEFDANQELHEGYPNRE